jgi:mono/diheme cytochrome c family protein
MRLRPIHASVLLAAMLGTAACSEQTPAEPVVLTQVATGFVADNHTYDTVCGRCHEVGVGPQLRGRQLPAALVTGIVRNGMSAMPAFSAAAISDEQLSEVAQFIEASQAPATQEPTNGQ